MPRTQFHLAVGVILLCWLVESVCCAARGVLVGDANGGGMRCQGRNGGGFAPAQALWGKRQPTVNA